MSLDPFKEDVLVLDMLLDREALFFVFIPGALLYPFKPVFILALFVVSVMFFHVNATKSHDYLFFCWSG